MENEITKSRSRITKLVKMAMLGAISVVLVAIIHIPFPLLPILVYDPANIPILIATFAYGPGGGILLTFAVAILQGITVSPEGGIYGIIMHIIATGTLVLVAGGIYRHKKSRKNAVVALVCGTLAMAVVMVIANILITPLYFQMPRAAVYPMLPAIIAFNLMKAGINSLITFLIYKRISGFLHK